MIFGRAALLLAVGCFAVEVPAAAEPASSDARRQADLAFEQGKEAQRRGDWAAACARFQTSFDFEPSPSTGVKLARCREHEERLVDAVAEYRRADALNQSSARDSAHAREIASVIDAELRRLEPTVPTLSVQVSPADAQLAQATLDGHTLTEGLPHGMLVDPGRHVLVVRAPGYRPATLELELARGAHRELEVALVIEVSEASPPAPAPVAPARATVATPSPPLAASHPSEPGDGNTQRVVGGALVGTGAAALLVAGYFGIRTLSLVNEANPYCDQVRGDCSREGITRLDSARRAQTEGIVAAGIGGALAVGGVVLYVLAPRRPSDERSRRELEFVLADRSAALRGSF